MRPYFMHFCNTGFIITVLLSYFWVDAFFVRRILEALTRSSSRTPQRMKCSNSMLRIDRNSGTCYEIGSHGPCGINMIFYAELDNEEYGVCDCAHAHEARTLIYYEPHDQCYFVFQQAYCQLGQWLTFNRETEKPTCETNPCFTLLPWRLLDSYVEHNGICVPLNSSCGKNLVLKFIPGFILPRCSGRSSSLKAIGYPVRSCKAGSSLAYNGKCVPRFVW